MKKIKLSLVVVALVAICSAFATSTTINKLSVFYPISNGSGGYTWATTTGSLSCLSNGPGCAGYTATQAPADNFTPNDYVSDGNKIWR
jgi:membrane-bound metal-dependent hydrolase YbcI (DUF457 family)